MNGDLTFPVPTALGSLDNYIQAVKAFPLLSAEDEDRLARRLRGHNDLEAAKMLILSHLRVVVTIARGYMGYGLPQADLIQEGNVGLMKAVKRFDPDRGVRLVSFAVHWIRAEIHEYIIRNWRMVKIATTKAQRKLFFNLRSLKQSLGFLSQDEIKSLAQQLEVKPEEVMEMELRLSGQDFALESSADEEEGYQPIHYLADPAAEPLAQLESQQQETLLTDGLAHALAGLDERSRHIIEARWLNPETPRTLHDLAAEYQISAERVRQIETKALKKMKALMAPAGD